MNQIKQNRFRWIYLLIGTMAMISCGVTYAWAILKTPLAEEFGWTQTQLALNSTLSMVFIAVGNLLAGQLARRISTRMLIIESAVCMFLGFFISSRMNNNIFLLYFCNAGLCGIGIGLFVVTIINVMGRWFEDRKGFSTSVLQMGLGFGGMVVSIIVNFLTNTFDLGWRMIYFLLGVMIGAVLMAAAFIIKEPEEGGRQKEDYQVSSEKAVSNVKTRQMIQRREFQSFYLMNLLVGTVGSVMLNFTNDFFLSLGSTVSMAVLVVGCVSVGNGLGRFLIGIIYDYKGRMFTIFIIVCSALGSSLLLLISAVTEKMMPGMLGAILAGASFGFVPSAASPIIREWYGNQYFASNYSVTLTNSVPASLMAAVAGGILTAGGSFTSIYLILLILSAGSYMFYFNLKQKDVPK